MTKINISKTFDRGIVPKGKLALAFLAFACCCLLACNSEDKPTNPEITAKYEIGKNYYTMDIDGDTREYYVHVPSVYDANIPTPVVFMLHGTSGDGDRFYKISGWKELGEVENILTVYPSSWKYCIIDDGKKKNTTKWNAYPGGFQYCAGETPRDDIKFLKQIVIELKEYFNVDSKRMYLVGFSNGGSMAGRCAVEMSDVFAAVVESAGTLPRDTTFVPKRKLPVAFQLGNLDDKWFGKFPFDIMMTKFDTILTNLPMLWGIVQTHANTFGFDSTYTVSGDSNSLLVATFEAATPNPLREFKFALIKDLGHNYPNGTNHPVNGAKINWNWMKQFTLP